MIPDTMEDRWSLSDLENTVAWCKKRKGQGIRCTVTTMAEFARTPAEARAGLEAGLTGIRTLGATVPGVAWAVKPSAIGILADARVYRENLSILAREAGAAGISLEIDMEGRPLVEATLSSALALASEDMKVTLALQAYLDRTPRDLATCREAGIPIRLVKGAYLGDTADFVAIQKRFRTVARDLMDAGTPFSAATHDPELISWLEEEAIAPRHLVEFAFLKGLADLTKTRLISEGWNVTEYVPYGPGGEGYFHRRERYLAMLELLGRAPAP
jgi:proline dehydrogenase